MKLFLIIMVAVSRETVMTVHADPFLISSIRTKDQMEKDSEYELYRRYPKSTHKNQSLMVHDITAGMPNLGIQWIEE